jgi:hypothetical protein
MPHHATVPTIDPCRQSSPHDNAPAHLLALMALLPSAGSATQYKRDLDNSHDERITTEHEAPMNLYPLRVP